MFPVWIDCPGCRRIYSRHLTTGDRSRDGTLKNDALATCPNCERVVLFGDLKKRGKVWAVRDNAISGATYQRLASEIAEELQAQLAMSEVQLDADDVQAIAEQVANEVVAHFNVVEKDSTTRR